MRTSFPTRGLAPFAKAGLLAGATGLMLSLGTLASAAELVSVPGTRVSIAPPSGFVLSSRFAGFEREELASAIVVSEISTPFAEFRTGFSSEALQRGGITLLDDSEALVSGHEAIVLHVRQRESMGVFEKWMVVFGNASASVMLVASFPQAVADQVSAPIRQAVLSSHWDADKNVGTFDGLGFRLTETASLKVAARMANTLLVTEGGRTEEGAGGAPFLMVTRAEFAFDPAEVEGMARQRLAEIAGPNPLTDTAGKAVVVDGLAAYELTARMNDLQTGQESQMYQLLATDGAIIYLIEGSVDIAKAERFLPEFRQLATSLERTR